MDEISFVTFLHKMPKREVHKRRDLHFQLRKAVTELRKTLPKSRNFELDFVRMFKLQMKLTQADFAKVGLEFKIRFLCFFFCTFVNKVRVLVYFKDFFPNIKICPNFAQVKRKYAKYFKNKTDFSTMKLQKFDKKYLLTPKGTDFKFLRRMFPEGESFLVEGTEYSYLQGITVIKKLLIFLVMVLDNLKLFVAEKTKNRVNFRSHIDPSVSQVNRKAIKLKIKDKKLRGFQYKLDEGLLGLSVEDITDKVRVEDLLLFVRLTQVNFLDKTKHTGSTPLGMRETVIYLKSHTGSSPKIDLEPDIKRRSSRTRHPNDVNLQNWACVSLREFEVDEILLAKRKRSDEKLKHGFKAFRKKFRANFRLEKQLGQSEDVEKLIEGEIFGHDADLGKKFRDLNITKEIVSALKKSRPLVRHMRKYIRSRYLLDEIDVNVLKKDEDFLLKSRGIGDFLLTLMTKQKKQGWILQNILNALEELEHCREDTILKRKTKYLNKRPASARRRKAKRTSVK